jgi:stage V sporulation protein G
MANKNYRNTKNNSHKAKVPYVKAQIDRLTDSNGESKIRAYASVTIGNAFAVHGIKVIESDKGTFVGMPNRSYEDKNGETKYSDVFHSITKEGYQAINNAVINAYEQELNNDIEEVDDEIEEFEQSM